VKSSAAAGRLHRLYVSEGYRGVAIVTTEAGVPGVAYLDKFAVAPSAQGDKLGEVLWRAMVAGEGGRLYWRSRGSNRVNPWYYEQSEGCYKTKAGDWTVFWRGLGDAEIMNAVSAALALPPTFAPRVYAAAAADGASPGRGAAALVQPMLK
jgi:acetylglutamate synthase